MKNINIMKPIDDYLVLQIEKLKEHSQYQRLIDNFSTLEENEQSVIKGIMMISLIIVPLLVIIIFYSITSSLKSELAVKESILQSSKNIISLTNDVKRDEMKALSPHAENESRFKSDISRALSRSGIDNSRMQINNIVFNEQGGNINEVQADIIFKGLSSANMYDFFNDLLIRKKVRLDEIQIKKDVNTHLLDGTASLFYYSKILVEETR